MWLYDRGMQYQQMVALFKSLGREYALSERAVCTVSFRVYGDVDVVATQIEFWELTETSPKYIPHADGLLPREIVKLAEIVSMVNAWKEDKGDLLPSTSNRLTVIREHHRRMGI